MIQFGSWSIDLASIMSAAALLVGAVGTLIIGVSKRNTSRRNDRR